MKFLNFSAVLLAAVCGGVALANSVADAAPAKATKSVKAKKVVTKKKTAAPAAPAAPAAAPADEATRLLRFPDIYGETVVFSHGGDLWKASTRPGLQTATRLTAHPGLELFPKISPDGKWVAFTGQYDGDEQVYVIPIEGGQPRQLTFYPSGSPVSPLNGSDNLVYGWTPDGKKILFRSVRDANAVTEFGTLYTVPFEGGFPEKLGPPNAGAASFSPDGKRIVYSPKFRDFRAWKRYAGGKTQALFIFDLDKKTELRLDTDPRTQRDPVWCEDKIYYVSDRANGTLNIFAVDGRTWETTQVTSEQTWDVRWASGGRDGQIIYELAGELMLFDTRAAAPANRFRKLKIRVPHDGLAMRPNSLGVGGRIEQIATAPGGKRVAVIARGDLFTAPVEKGFSHNLTNTSNAHERCPAYSRDGKQLAYVSDVTGEEQIYIRDVKDAAAAPVQLTTTLRCQLSDLQFSPCGRYVSVNDVRSNLWIVPVVDGLLVGKRGVPVKVVTSSVAGGTPRAAWSPCGAFIAYTLNDAQDFGRLFVYEVATRKVRAVTDPLYDVGSPAWSPDGKFLWYLTRREFAPQFSTVEWNFAGNRNTAIVGLLLRKDVKNPFGPQFGDEEPEEPKKDEKSAGKVAGDAKKDATKDAKQTASKDEKKNVKKPDYPAPTRIDWQGLAARAVRVPVEPDNIHSLSANDKFLFYVKTGASFYGRGGERPPALHVFDIGARKESVLLGGAGGYDISPDLAFITANAGGHKVVEAKAGGSAKPLRTDALRVESVPALEWREIFEEVWRKYRDHFYVRNMHGYNWNALGKQYRALLPHVAHRHDLSYILTELIGELNIGHAYIMGGEYYKPARPKYGLPGATFTVDKKHNLYRIAKIYRGQNEEPRYRSPLTEPGLDARAGDFVLAINGVPLSGSENIYQRLRDKTDPVTLTLSATAAGSTGAKKNAVRKVTYVPLESESSLRYLNIVLTNYDRVHRASNGKLGYVHIPDMGGAGAYEFIKWYYPQIRKPGLVIDARGNRGGNISQWLIQRLNQKLLGTRFGGVATAPDAYPANARHGTQVCLINENAGSDGDIFPYNFRRAGLGPLIGSRTWGGVVGISGVGPLLDGGGVTVPLRGTNETDGRWIIEGHGVDPDIEVENDATSMLAGTDPQLERGITVALEQLEYNPHPWPHRPADPVKTKPAYVRETDPKSAPPPALPDSPFRDGSGEETAPGVL